MHLHVLFIPEMKLGERSVACGRKKAGESVDFVPWKHILVWWYDQVIWTLTSERWILNEYIRRSAKNTHVRANFTEADAPKLQKHYVRSYYLNNVLLTNV